MITRLYDSMEFFSATPWQLSQLTLLTARTRIAHPSRHVNVVREGDDVALLTQDGDVRWDAEAKRFTMRQTDDGHVYQRSESSLPETQEDETLPEPQLAKRSGTSITEESKRKNKLSKDSHPTSETTESSVPFEKPVKVREVKVQQEKAATKQCVGLDSSESCGSSFASKIMIHTSANVMKLQRK